ncbi:MAG: hypothetical protein VR65_21930 [Desulfobulbaceae bacterium BRH_c16a]|nr:MAG: hypothetical protein VR65_21930 [Desulfobulbaceae bacterium BRH_c16a]
MEDLLVVFLHHQKQEGHGGDGDGRAVSLSLRPPSPFCSCRNGLESLKALRRLGERILVMILATCGALRLLGRQGGRLHGQAFAININ